MTMKYQSEHLSLTQPLRYVYVVSTRPEDNETKARRIMNMGSLRCKASTNRDNIGGCVFVAPSSSALMVVARKMQDDTHVWKRHWREWGENLHDMWFSHGAEPRSIVQMNENECEEYFVIPLQTTMDKLTIAVNYGKPQQRLGNK